MLSIPYFLPSFCSITLSFADDLSILLQARISSKRKKNARLFPIGHLPLSLKLLCDALHYYRRRGGASGRKSVRVAEIIHRGVQVGFVVILYH